MILSHKLESLLEVSSGCPLRSFSSSVYTLQRHPTITCSTTTCLKGKLGDFFLFVQSFYRPKTKTSVNRQFSPKSPKVGQKSGQRVKNWPNKNQVASDLLRESTDSVIRAAEGIHQFCPPTYWGNPLVDNFSIRPAEGIHRFCHRSYWGNPSILSSDLLRESIRTNQLCYVKNWRRKNSIRIECRNIGWKGKWFNKSSSPEPWCPKCQFITPVPNSESHPNIAV